MAALGVVGRGASARSPARQMEIPLAGALCVPRRNWRISLHGFDVAPIDRMAGTQVVSRNAKHFVRRANALRRRIRLRIIGASVARDSRFGSGFCARITGSESALAMACFTSGFARTHLAMLDR